MIKGFIFEGFKGYDKAVLWLEQVTTLIGSNASGKSNAIEGIQILSELASGRELNVIFDGTSNTESAVRGGAKGCCRFAASSFTLGCLVNWNDTHDLLYRISIGVDDRVAINSEELHMVRNGNTKANGTMVFKATASSGGGDIAVIYANGKRGANPHLNAIRSMSVLSQMQGRLPANLENYDDMIDKINLVRNSLSNIFILDPIPSMMRGYSRIGDSILRRNCANVSAVLYALKQKHVAEWSEFEQIVRELPENEIKEISFVKTSISDVILVQKEENGSTFANMDAARLSDGTLRCVAALAAVMSEPENSLIAIEELDNGLHPSRAQRLMAALSGIGKRRHIDLLITTHNVTLLNSLSKDEVLGVSVVYRDANTKASRITSFVDIRNQQGLLAAGGIGDALASEAILRAIKDTSEATPFAF